MRWEMRWHRAELVDLWTCANGGLDGLVASNKEQYLLNEGVRETSNGTGYLGTPETTGE